MRHGGLDLLLHDFHECVLVGRLRGFEDSLVDHLKSSIEWMIRLVVAIVMDLCDIEQYCMYELIKTLVWMIRAVLLITYCCLS